MPSRISGACNACRTRKQKCSGDRSGCAQCREAGHECTWPTQKKRGPAKGYIEGLEHRLHDAEQLLLQVLPLVSTTQLDAITTQVEHGGSPSRAGLRVTPPLLNKKTGIEYWEQYPLDSVESIRRWQNDCATGRRDSSKPRRNSPACRGASQGLDYKASAGPKRRLEEVQSGEGDGSPGYNLNVGSDAQAQAWASPYKVPEIAMNAAHFSDNSGPQWRANEQSWPQTTVGVPSNDGQIQSPGSAFFTDESQKHHLFW